MLLGEEGQTWLGKTAIDIQLMGFESDPHKLAIIYSALDLVAIPSVVENFPNVLIEALACGRSVVASDAGGMLDGICHMETGYLAKLGDVYDFTDGLRLVLNDETVQQKMEVASQNLFEDCFTNEKELSRIVYLYRNIIN